MWGARTHLLPHRALDVREPVEIHRRTVGREGIRGEAGRFGLAEVVVGPRDQRRQIGRSVGIVGRPGLRAPRAESREEFVLGRGSNPVAGSVRAVAANQERHPRLTARLVRALRGLGDHPAVENRRRLDLRCVGSRRRRRAAQDLLGTERAQTGRCGRVDTVDSHPTRECDADRFGRHRIVRIDAVAAHRPRREYAVTRPARLGDGLVEQAACHRRRQEAVYRHAARRESEHRHIARVTAKGGDVPLHPLQRRDLIQVGIVAFGFVRTLAAQCRDREETTTAQAIVDADEHDALLGQLRAGRECRRPGAAREPAAMDPHHHRQTRRARAGGAPDVQEEAVRRGDTRRARQRGQRIQTQPDRPRHRRDSWHQRSAERGPKPCSRKCAMSLVGARPKKRPYSRVNCDGLR